MSNSGQNHAPRSALIVIDVQTCFTRPAAAFDSATASGDSKNFFRRVDDTVIPALQRLLAHQRARQWPVYFTEMGSLRADGGDLPRALRRANRTSIEASGKPAVPPLDDPDARVDVRITPQEDEVVLRKTTTGTLASSPLAQNLRALDCASAWVTGVVTDCCVSQTARELADQDFEVTVIEDACASYVPAHHQAVLEIFANFYGTVRSSQQVIDGPDAR